MQICARCEARPSGHDGHEGLVPGEGESFRQAIFRCSRCGCRWRRFWFERNRFCWTLQVPLPVKGLS